MGDWCSGLGNKPLEIIPGTPQDVAGLRGGIINALTQNLSKGVPTYGGPMAGMDPLQMMASNLMAKQMGYGGYGGPNMFQAPKFPQTPIGYNIDWTSGKRLLDKDDAANQLRQQGPRKGPPGKIRPGNLGGYNAR